MHLQNENCIFFSFIFSSVVGMYHFTASVKWRNDYDDQVSQPTYYT